ncbi:MAG: nucleoside monophosphate kinase, partial [Nanoarchaeota archaeon]|nr:nucleoside monophosphate kinase [Nanoarchaeota archaeon]
IKKLQEYLKTNTFVGFLLGPKNSGKGTYSKLFKEAVGEEHVRHISVGDVVRSIHNDFEDKTQKKELVSYLKNTYRGVTPLNDAIDALLGRNTTTLLPTEIILTLVEREIAKSEKKAIFIDGFPRSLDQISYSLYFRTLMGYREDPDFFVFIDVPEAVIDERMKYRVVCPVCQTPRSTKLLKTKEVGYDKKKDEVFLICDNPGCNNARLTSKEGDNLGIEAIRNRIEADKEVMNTLLTLEGVPKIYLRNAIPKEKAEENIDAYEATPSYRYEVDKKTGKVTTVEEPWVVKDEKGTPSYSLLPPAIVVSLLKQITNVLNL